MRYLMMTTFSCVSMWMSEARRWIALKTTESTSLMIGEASCGDPVDREGLLALLVLGDELHPEVLGRLVEDPLRGLALLEDVGDRGAAADLDPQRQADEELELVEAHDVGRVGADDRHRRARVRLSGHEVVAEHPLHRDRAEEVGVDAEREEVDVGKPQPLGERDAPGPPPRPRRGEPDFAVQLLGHGTRSLPLTT